MTTLTIVKGSTYRDTLRWATGECVLKPCTISSLVPLTITCVDHGLIDGWHVQIENYEYLPARNRYPISLLTPDTFSLPCVNGGAFRTGAAQLRYYTPVDMDGYTARMQIRDRVGGELLVELTTENGGITLDNVDKLITREIPADVTAALATRRGVYDFEMVSGDYVVKIDSGTVVIQDEVTV